MSVTLQEVFDEDRGGYVSSGYGSDAYGLGVLIHSPTALDPTK